ncbi:hypothetical protein Sjap_020683 [Stephania japonica]|uniref:Uncharacterized protein n=1 Tax=Stephania japonica TaxID=461633 RepID=A0AAP0F1W6_9MAGN
MPLWVPPHDPTRVEQITLNELLKKSLPSLKTCHFADDEYPRDKMWKSLPSIGNRRLHSGANGNEELGVLEVDCFRTDEAEVAYIFNYGTRWVTPKEKLNSNAVISSSSGEEDEGIDIGGEVGDEMTNILNEEVGSDVGVEHIKDNFENDRGRKYRRETKRENGLDPRLESNFEQARFSKGFAFEHDPMEEQNCVAFTEPMPSAAVNLSLVRDPVPFTESPYNPSQPFSLHDAATYNHQGALTSTGKATKHNVTGVGQVEEYGRDGWPRQKSDKWYTTSLKELQQSNYSKRKYMPDHIDLDPEPGFRPLGPLA